MTCVVIAGAGIGGLTAALALAQVGVEVEVFERAERLDEVGAGLQISPNATRLLARLGILDRLLATAVKLEAVRIRRGRDGADLARMPLGVTAEARYGSPFLVTHRADLHSALLDAAIAHSGITITTGQGVETFSHRGERVVVAVRGPGGDLRTLTTDGLVGADGLHSIVRSRLGDADLPRFSQRTAWRALVPAERAPEFARLPASNLWLGRKAHLVHYPIRNGTLINVVAIVQDGWHGDAGTDVWAVPGDPARLRRPFEAWCADARALVRAVPEWRIWPLFDRPPLLHWSQGRATLVGDAAHPMLPFLAQGASQAIEDGWALGQAVGRHGRDLPAAFTTYEAARRPTADRAQRESRQQGTLYHLGPPASVLRDFGMQMLGPARMLERYDWLYRASLGA